MSTGRIHLDYYATLEVTPQASDEDIKRAYRKLALKYHPDRNQGNARAEENIRELNAAYEVLGNPETRRSYERLRFGGHGRNVDIVDEAWAAPSADVLAPGVLLERMETKLREEGRLEIYRKLLHDLPRIKQELAGIRPATVAALGYDKWSEAIVKRHAGPAIAELVTPAMEECKTRLLDTAVQMMLSQGVGSGRESGTDWLERQLAEAFHLGRVDGYCEACELFYVRQ